LRISLFLFYLLSTILAQSQTQLSFDTSKLVKGSGIVSVVNANGKNFGSIAYKNGHMDGSYYAIDTSGQFALRGMVRYSPSCVNSLPGIEVNYISQNNDTVWIIVDSISFEKMYKIPSLRIMSIKKASSHVTVIGIHPELGFNFGDSAVVPIGKWQYLNLKDNYVFKEYNFDECGNVITAQLFDTRGVLIKKIDYKKKKQKKIFWR
jgi:hypothetical protein